MEIAIIHNGQIFTLGMDNIEDYDWTKAYAQMLLADTLKTEIERIQKYED